MRLVLAALGAKVKGWARRAVAVAVVVAGSLVRAGRGVFQP